METVADYEFLESFKRKRIMLVTNGSTFVGVVQRINLNRTVVLEQVVELQSGSRLPGAKLFFGHEILSVELPPSEPLKMPSEVPEEAPVLPVAEFQPYRRKLMEDEAKFVSYVVVDEFHENFGPALMHIRKQQVIGLGADGAGASGCERLCWLQVATKNKVYLFDVLLLGARAFRNGLSSVLESEDVLKVVHDCRGVSGCLAAQFGVELANVFDTQVADVVHFYGQTGGFLPEKVSSMQEVVGSHLKISDLGSLRIKDELSMQDKEVWYVRPCPGPLLKVMALSVIHLQPLRLVLLDALMSDYTSLVASYLKGGREELVPIGDVGGTRLELSRELQELPTIRRTRRNWAVNHYSVTEDGFLLRHGTKVRPGPELKSETPDPDPEEASQRGLMEPPEAAHRHGVMTGVGQNVRPPLVMGRGLFQIPQ